MEKPNKAMRKLLIAVAANELARTREFDAITVDMICERAQVSRSSFYRTFQDKYEILLWCEEFPFQRGIAQMGRTLTCLEGMTVMFEGFEMFHALFLSTRTSSERVTREDGGRLRAGELILETLAKHQGLEVDEGLEFQVRWTARNLLDIAVIWTKKDDREKPEDLARLAYPCVPERLRSYLDKPVEGNGVKRLNLESFLLADR